MPVIEMPTETINPQTLSRWQIERELQALCSRVQTPARCEEHIRARFQPKPHVWVQERGRNFWGVLLQVSPTQESQSYLVARS